MEVVVICLTTCVFLNKATAGRKKPAVVVSVIRVLTNTRE